MKSSRWAATLVTSVVFMGAVTGCQPPKPVEPPPPPAPTVDAVEALRAKYIAAGNLAGKVEGVNAEISAAAVRGIDPAAGGADTAVYHFIDPSTDTIINNGTLDPVAKGPTASGALIVRFDPTAARAPQIGDIVVRRK